MLTNTFEPPPFRFATVVEGLLSVTRDEDIGDVRSAFPSAPLGTSLIGLKDTATDGDIESL